MQSLTGAENSFRQSDTILNKLCFFNRPINNNSRIQRTVTQVGQELSELKKQLSWGNSKEKGKELILNVDGGHIKSNINDKRSIEVMIAHAYDPKNRIYKDKRHNVINNKTCVASALSGKLSSIKKLAKNACAKQGMTKDTHITALSDGAKNCWSIINSITSECASITRILDWFHIGKKYKNVEHVIPKEHIEVFERSKCNLWHGNIEKSLFLLTELKNLVDKDYKIKIISLSKYISNNCDYIINYNDRKEQGLVYTSNISESSVNSIINTRQKQNQKMQWSREGAHSVVQIRTSNFSNSWEDDWSQIQNKIYKEAA